MSGIYIHIPFCKQACSYCDFHFSTNQKLRQPLIDALCKEIEQRKEELQTAPETLYFGGGSPSILSAAELTQIFDTLHQHYDLSALKEVTLESNPDDHSAESLRLWKLLGVNRLSIGIQSFIDRDLLLMNRAHNAEHAGRCVESARDAGFNSLTIDLIYGIPNQSMDEWQSNVSKAIALAPDHISAYCLTVEEKTALDHRIKKGEVTEKQDDTIEAEFLHLHSALEKAGFAHYEISNFGRGGKQALHNGNYWSGRPYLGLGPAAHSFDGRLARKWNVANNAVYIKALKSGASFWEEEVLSETDRANEQLMTALRTAKGLDLAVFSTDIQRQILASIHCLPEALKTMIEFDKSCIRILPEHWLMTDALLRHLFIQS